MFGEWMEENEKIIEEGGQTMTKEQEEAIKKLEYYLQNSVYKKVDSDSFEDNWELVNLEIPQAIETVLNILKQNSAELTEKSAELEKYKSLYNKALEDLVKADRENIENKKVIDLMVKAMNKIQDPQVCKYCDNNINLNHGYCTDAKKCKEGIKQYFERKSKNEN